MVFAQKPDFGAYACTLVGRQESTRELCVNLVNVADTQKIRYEYLKMLFRIPNK